MAKAAPGPAVGNRPGRPRLGVAILRERDESVGAGISSVAVQLVIRGRQLPGRQCGGHRDVHVGLQVGSRAEGLVPADVPSAEWRTEVHVSASDDGPDFRGPAVQGRRGERFVYLTWGELTDGCFSMFRRAKLMLADLAPCSEADSVVVDVDLTGEDGLPRCARLRPPAVHRVDA